MKKPVETDTAAKRRLGAEGSQNRHALLDAAELIMREEGYAAVTSRHVANRAGLKPQLVYYYFRTMDDLLLALFQRRSERSFEHLNTLLAEPRPLHTLWELLCDPAHGGLTSEFMALANHRKIIGDAIARQAEQLRALQAELLARALRERGMESERFPPIVFSMLLATMSQVLVRERALGIVAGHAELTTLIESFLDQLEPPAPASNL